MGDQGCKVILVIESQQPCSRLSFKDGGRPWLQVHDGHRTAAAMQPGELQGSWDYGCKPAVAQNRSSHAAKCVLRIVRDHAYKLVLATESQRLCSQVGFTDGGRPQAQVCVGHRIGAAVQPSEFRGWFRISCASSLCSQKHSSRAAK